MKIFPKQELQKGLVCGNSMRIVGQYGALLNLFQNRINICMFKRLICMNTINTHTRVNIFISANFALFDYEQIKKN